MWLFCNCNFTKLKFNLKIRTKKNGINDQQICLYNQFHLSIISGVNERTIDGNCIEWKIQPSMVSVNSSKQYNAPINLHFKFSKQIISIEKTICYLLKKKKQQQQFWTKTRANEMQHNKRKSKVESHLSVRKQTNKHLINNKMGKWPNIAN